MEIADVAAHDLLERSMVARLASVSRTGRPHVNPLYFVVGSQKIQLGTATNTLAAHNVAANGVVQILFEVESDAADHRMLRMNGSAVVRTDPSLLASYRRLVARKYVATPRGLWNMLAHPRQWSPMRRHLSGGAACVIEVTPTDVALAPDSTAHIAS